MITHFKMPARGDGVFADQILHPPLGMTHLRLMCVISQDNLMLHVEQVRPAKHTQNNQFVLTHEVLHLAIVSRQLLVGRTLV